MDFSFGVITYNSSNYILETLNSIKYQVENFGQGKKLELIVSDDASVDNTVVLVDKWIELNSYLFNSVKLLKSDINRGTVNNYFRVYDEVKSEHFHILAGDDLYSNLDIFKYFNLLREDECLTTMPIMLSGDNELSIDRHRFERFVRTMYRQNCDNLWLLRKEMLGAYIHTPSTIFYKRLITSDVRKFVEQFVLFEDDPRWYQFLKRGVKFRYIVYPIVIYRNDGSSVSKNVFDRPKTPFETDMLKLYSYYCKDKEVSAFRLKLYLRLKSCSIKNRRQSFFCLIYREIDYIIAKLVNSLSHRGADERRIMGSVLNENKDYYRNIRFMSAQQ